MSGIARHYRGDLGSDRRSSAACVVSSSPWPLSPLSGWRWPRLLARSPTAPRTGARTRTWAAWSPTRPTRTARGSTAPGTLISAEGLPDRRALRRGRHDGCGSPSTPPTRTATRSMRALATPTRLYTGRTERPARHRRGGAGQGGEGHHPGRSCPLPDSLSKLPDEPDVHLRRLRRLRGHQLPGRSSVPVQRRPHGRDGDSELGQPGMAADLDEPRRRATAAPATAIPAGRTSSGRPNMVAATTITGDAVCRVDQRGLPAGHDRRA